MILVETAQKYLDANLSVVPVGNKKPLVKWGEYQQRQPTADELGKWFAKPAGIAVVAGAVSGNLEVIDIDAPELAQTFGANVEAQATGLLASLPLSRTPSGGYHVFYRCPDIAGNLRLARSADGSILIETRGEGGMATVAPTLGYKMLRGAMTEIPTITPEERQHIHAAASALNEYEPPQPERVYTAPTTPNGDRPGDVFNASADWYDILSKHGWRLIRTRHDKTQEWCRPGKDEDGTSATVGVNGHDVFYVFSSNAAPFEPDRGYTKFSAYALLEHRGDVSSAAKWLAAENRASVSVAI